ncbi:MAG TPA: hypothetical protein VIM61_05515 [Chthoniobacterales bacterium]|jgi:hypothetical protein
MNLRCLFLLAILALSAPALRAQADREYVFLSGGPSLIEWEKFKAAPHDRWWGNFIRPARVRFEQLRKQYGAGARITWLVYKPAYVRRSERQDHTDLVSNIVSVRDKYGINLIWITSGQDVINYLNGGMPRDQVKIANFEFFGHSNSRCFMFDYSNEIDSGSKAFLHQDQLKQIHRGIFTRDAFVKSWGCHTGETMSAYWKRATGKKMIGAIGKTDYSGGPTTNYMPVVNGRWGG